MTRRSVAYLGMALASFLAISGLAVAREVPFAPRQDLFAMTGDPVGPAMADMDGDGDMDLYGMYNSTSGLMWAENTAGDGTGWALQVVGPFSTLPSDVATGDLDGDGDQDMIAAGGTAGLMTWFENADGAGLTWNAEALAINASSAQSIALSDISGDGRQDIAFSDPVNGSVYFLAWNASSALRVVSPIGGYLLDPQAIAIADFDGDGDPDVAVASPAGDLVQWRENLDGAGGAWSTHAVASAFGGPAALMAGDLDGDGDLDLAAPAATGDRVAWFENQDGAGGSWATHTIDATIVNPADVALRDIDEDGDLDILAGADFAGQVVWYENLSGAGGWLRRTVDPAFAGASGVVAGDLDGDGDLDLAAVSATASAFGWWRNLAIHRNAIYPQEFIVANAANSARCAMPGDIDGDGDLDLATASFDDDTIAWYENLDGAGTFGPINVISNSAGGAHQARPADMDGDGDLDVLASYDSGQHVVWFENMDGLGTFGTMHTISVISAFPFWVNPVDTDGDGDLDVLVGAGGATAQFQWFRNTGGGAFVYGGLIDGSRDQANSIEAADIDGDGDLDTVTASGNDDIVAWHENTDGLGTFGPRQVISTAGDRPMAVAAADLDGDGDPDVLTASDGDGLVAWHENTDGLGAFGPRQALGTTGGTRAIAVDLDGDGDLDVLAGGNGLSPVAWFENLDGQANFGALQTAGSSVSDGRWVAAGDIDRDGLVDLIAASSSNDTVAWYRNRGGQFGIDATDIAPVSILEGAADAVLQLVARHNGRSGDTPVEVSRFELLFEESPGDPLSEAEANALIDAVIVYADDGSGAWEPGVDSLVTSMTTLAWNPSGTLSVSLADGAAAARVDHGTSATYFLATQLTALASIQAVNQFRLTATLNPDGPYPEPGADDRDFDIPLYKEYGLDVVSGIVLARQGAPTTPTLSPEPSHTSSTQNTVYWTPVVGAASFVAQCSQDPTFGSLLYNASTASTVHEYTFSPLADNVLYYYRVGAWGPTGGFSGWSDIESSRQDDSPPDGTVEIDSGNVYTNQLSVTLDLDALDPNPSSSGVADMRFRNDAAMTWSAWQTYQPTATWNLRDLDGTRTVYAQFRDAVGNVSDGLSTDTILLDRVAPTVTVEQASTQDDPTDTVPILFEVVFSEPVLYFGAEDVDMGGTAGPTASWVVWPLGGGRYQIRVNTVGHSGTLIPTIPAGGAEDAAGNLNLASTSVDNVVTYFVDIEIVSPRDIDGGFFGFSVAGIEDVDEDDHGDVIVGAYREDSGAGITAAGRVYVMNGDDGSTIHRIDSPEEVMNGAFGYAVAAIDDIDGDGVQDIAIGAHRQQGENKTEGGRVYVFSGKTGTSITMLVSPDTQAYGYFGFSVARVSNVFGSGLPGLAVGAPGESEPGSAEDSGRAYLFYYDLSGAWQSEKILSTSPKYNGYFGYSIAGIDRIDGSLGGVVIGASGENVAYQYIPRLDAGRSRSVGKAEVRVLPVDAQAFGCSVAGVPDVDGDGRGDVIVGARAAYATGGPLFSGRAYLFNGYSRAFLRELKSPNEQAYGYFGHAVAGMHDVNGNGRGDVIVGAMAEDAAGQGFAGKVYLFDGATGELLRSFDSANAQFDGRYGCSVSAVPGPGFDGLDDIVVGAYGEDSASGLQAAGRAYIQATITAPSAIMTRASHWELYR